MITSLASCLPATQPPVSATTAPLLHLPMHLVLPLSPAHWTEGPGGQACACGVGLVEQGMGWVFPPSCLRICLLYMPAFCLLLRTFTHSRALLGRRIYKRVTLAVSAGVASATIRWGRTVGPHASGLPLSGLAD